MKPFDTNVLSANMVAQAGAKAALEHKDEWQKEMLDRAMENQTRIKEIVDEVDGTFIPVFPSRTNMLVIDISKTGLDPETVQRMMLREHDVFVRSGGYVSKRYGNRFIRVSFTVKDDGIERFSKAFLKTMGALRE